MINQVDKFGEWVNVAKIQITKPNTMRKYGTLLDNFGLDSMLENIMEGFVFPVSKGKAIYDLNAFERLFLLVNTKLSVVLQCSRKCVDQSLTLRMDLLLNMAQIGILT